MIFMMILKGKKFQRIQKIEKMTKIWVFFSNPKRKNSLNTPI